MCKTFLSLLTACAAIVLPQFVAAEEGKRPDGPRPEMKHDRPSPDAFLKRFDANHDGAIKADELPAGMPEQVKQMIMRADKNHDGKVTQEELTQAMQQRRSGPRPEGRPGDPSRGHRLEGGPSREGHAWRPEGGHQRPFGDGERALERRPRGPEAGPTSRGTWQGRGGCPYCGHGGPRDFTYGPRRPQGGPQAFAHRSWGLEAGRGWHGQGGMGAFGYCPRQTPGGRYALGQGPWGPHGKWQGQAGYGPGGHHGYRQYGQAGHRMYGPWSGDQQRFSGRGPWQAGMNRHIQHQKVARLAAHVRKIFVKLDANKDGKVTMSEVPKDRCEMFKHILAKFDGDHDGAINKVEAKRAVVMIAKHTQKGHKHGPHGRPGEMAKASHGHRPSVCPVGTSCPMTKKPNEAKKSEAKQPETKKPAPKQPEVKKSAAKNSEATKPEAKTAVNAKAKKKAKELAKADEKTTTKPAGKKKE